MPTVGGPRSLSLSPVPIPMHPFCILLCPLFMWSICLWFTPACFGRFTLARYAAVIDLLSPRRVVAFDRHARPCQGPGQDTGGDFCVSFVSVWVSGGFLPSYLSCFFVVASSWSSSIFWASTRSDSRKYVLQILYSVQQYTMLCYCSV